MTPRFGETLLQPPAGVSLAVLGTAAQGPSAATPLHAPSQARVASRNSFVIDFKAACFDTLAIVMQLCDTSLSDYLRAHEAAPAGAAQVEPYPQLSWSFVTEVAKQAASALSCLHDPNVGILHNDVRADNMVLLMEGCRQHVTLKICDLGLAQHVGQEEEVFVPAEYVTICHHMSPIHPVAAR